MLVCSANLKGMETSIFSGLVIVMVERERGVKRSSKEPFCFLHSILEKRLLVVDVHERFS